MKKLILATAIFLLCFAAIAQVSDETRDKNLQTVLTLLSTGTPEEGKQAANTFSAGLISSEAQALSVDWVRHQYKNQKITRTEYAKKMLSMNQSMAGNDLLTLDYWRYMVMIGIKADNKSIPEEEYDYLAGKKGDELDAALKARDNAVSQSASQARSTGQNWFGNVMSTIGAGMQNQQRQPYPVNRAPAITNCTRNGSQVSCVTN